MEKKFASDKLHVIVSGGSKGLGLALCQDLLACGYSVSTFSRSRTEGVDALLEHYPDQFYYDNKDMLVSSELAEFVHDAEARFGTFYGLVNNAAVVQDGVLATLPEIEIEKMVSINLFGAVNLTRLFLRRMLSAEFGRIINISSIIGSRGYSGLSVYAATKAGLDGMTRSLARELGSRHITVNSVAPGYMKSDLSKSLTQEQLNQISRRTPLGRLALTDDVVPIIRFLLSHEASFITGQTIMVDGGISV